MGSALNKKLTAIKRFDEDLPKVCGLIDGNYQHWTNEQLNFFANQLFCNGFVVIENFFDPSVVHRSCSEVVDTLETSGSLQICRELQRQQSALKPKDDFVYGSKIIYRASSSKGRSYDTGMLIGLEPEKMIPSLKQFRDPAVISKIISAVTQRKVTHTGQVLYLNESVTNPRVSHWDSLQLQFKAFLYLSDVENKADGPYSFVQGTHQSVRSRQLNAYLNHYTARHQSDALLYNPLSMKRFLGSAGTLIISNQRGYHGGTPQKRGRRRVLLVQNYLCGEKLT